MSPFEEAMFCDLQDDQMDQEEQLSQALLHACSLGEELKIQQLITDGANVNYTDPFVGSPLLAAISGGQTHLVLFLLDQKSNIYAVDCHGNQAIHMAAILGQYDVIKALLDRDESPDHVDAASPLGETPLHLACMHGHLDIASLLIQSGAQVTHTSALLMIPLHQACAGGHLDIVKMLIKEYGSDPEQVDKLSDNVLHKACSKGWDHIVRYLIDLGMSLDCKNEEKQTGLMMAASNGHLQTVVSLVDARCDLYLTDMCGENALLKASQCGHTTIVRYLHGQGMDLTGEDSDGWDTLDAACSLGHVSTANYLLKAGLDVNRVGQSGCTALTIACREHRLNVAKLLLEHGAIRVCRPQGTESCPLQVAIENNDPEIAHLLIAENYDFSLPQKVFLADRTFAVSQAVEKGLLSMGCLLVMDASNCNEPDFFQIDPDKYNSRRRGPIHLLNWVYSSKKFDRFRSWLEQHKSTSPSLKHLARLTVRRSLGNLLGAKVQKTGLPRALVNFIQYRDEKLPI